LHHPKPATFLSLVLLAACGGGGSGGSPADPSAQSAAVAGRVLLAATVQSDGDVNDPDAPFRANDELASAQPLPNPVVLGGYVNEAGHGPQGRSHQAGDLDDVYAVDLVAGQLIELVLPPPPPGTPDAERDDADLGLYDLSGVLVDEAAGVGPVEQLFAPADGRYHVRVTAVRGATLYRLAIGDAVTAAAVPALRLSDDFIPDEVIVTPRMPARAGGVRERLVRLPAGPGPGRRKSTPEPAARDRAGFTVPATLQARRRTVRMVKQLRRDPALRTADLNRRVAAAAWPNDPLYPLQRWHYELIGLPAAWNVTFGSRGVVVAIVDSGLAPHPEFTSSRVAGYDFVSFKLNGDGDGLDADPDDPGCATSGTDRFHGTHVAGTAAAAANDATGVAGVAGNVSIMPVRALDSCFGGTTYDLMQGMRFAAGLPNDSGRLPARRADVINLSLSQGGECDAGLAALAAELRSRGVIIVAAAGNDGRSRPVTPASCPGVVAVAALGPTRERAPYSNFGAAWVDLAAPGGDLRLDLDGDGHADGIYSTYASGSGGARTPGYAYLEGSSMAAAHVTGVVALMKSVDPGLTPEAFDTLLAQQRITSDIGAAGPDELGAGLIDAFAAVTAAGTGTPPTGTSLVVAPSVLDFGDVGLRADVLATKTGDGALVITGAISSAAWLRATSGDTDASGFGRYVVGVERAGLAAGTYEGAVDFVSNAGTRRLAVTMRVAGATVAPDAGRLYVELVDARTGEVAARLALRADGPALSYRFEGVRRGDYRIVAGTDLDNDSATCESGEACGRYPSVDAPVTVDVARELTGLDFAVSYP
jgi:serine protease